MWTGRLIFKVAEGTHAAALYWSSSNLKDLKSEKALMCPASNLGLPKGASIIYVRWGTEDF